MCASTLARTKERRKDGGRGARGRFAQLVLLIECERPQAGSIAVPLASELVVGRGSQRRVEAGAGGAGAGGAGGRDDGEAAVLRVPDEWMSSRHARIVRQGAQYAIEDLASKNGTIVNGEATRVASLRDGDVIELGQTFFVFREHAAAPPSAGEPLLMRTHNPELAAALHDLAAIASSAVPVLMLGETGTGKEVLARAVHARSGRAGDLVAVNCGALPETLVETELFGYRRGAFSGAVEDRPGLVRAADRGTLFLDEIGDLRPASQAALLRVLQEREVVPIGATRPIKVDLRIIAATNRDLDEMVDEGRFRADLLQRLRGFPIRLPPLRERREDLGELTATFLVRAAGERTPPNLATDAVRRLLAYHWPGNVRELEQAISAAVVLAGRGVAQARHLALAPARPATSPGPARRALTPAQEQHAAELRALLARHDGNVAAVGRALKKSRVQIHRWMSRYGIDPAEFRPL